MKFGVLKDIKVGEFRVIATPAEVSTIIDDGHQVFVETNAGKAAGFPDEEYESAGATIVSREFIWENCDFIAKVKEIEKSEYGFLKEGQIIYTCIHPAAHKEEVDALLEAKVTAITAEDSHRYGSPNCEAAGKAGAFLGLWSMMSNNGGCGKFASGLGSAPGVRALVCGAGTVGKASIEVLMNMGCWVTAADRNIGLMRDLSNQYDGKLNTIMSNKYNLTKELEQCDLVINAVRWPKDSTEYMISRDMVKKMHEGAVIVDISNDYGCIETFRETTHDDPIYIEEGVVHYCVSNIPAAIAGSTSVAYANAVLPHIRSILNNGLAQACARDGYLRRSLTTHNGYLTHEETSAIQSRPWVPPEKILHIEDQKLDPAPKTTTSVSENYNPDWK